VITGTPPTVPLPEGKRENNDFRFKPGWRVFACDYATGLEVRYTRLSATQRREITGSTLFATLGNPGTFVLFNSFSGSASSHLNFLYQRVEGIFQMQLGDGCSFDCDVFAGVQYASMRLREKVEYISATDTGIVKRKARSWGLGPQVGIDFYYPIPFCSCSCAGNDILSVTALASGSLLASKAKHSYLDQATATPNFDVHDESTWRIVPTWNARVGLNYTLSFCCVGAALEVGYEFISYIRALQKTVFVNNDDVSFSFTDFYDFDAQGLYVLLVLKF